VVWLWQGYVYKPKNSSARSSQSKYLGGAGAIPNYPVGRKIDQHMPTMGVQEGDIKTPYLMY
jgi:hypothetical protein